MVDDDITVFRFFPCHCGLQSTNAIHRSLSNFTSFVGNNILIADILLTNSSCSVWIVVLSLRSLKLKDVTKQMLPQLHKALHLTFGQQRVSSIQAG